MNAQQLNIISAKWRTAAQLGLVPSGTRLPKQAFGVESEAIRSQSRLN